MKREEKKETLHERFFTCDTSETSMIVSTETIHDVAVVKLQGSLDVSLQTTLKEQLEDLASKHDNDVVLDFSLVTFIDSSCLGAMVALLKRVRGHQGDIKIVGMNEEVKSIFQITRLDRVFELFDNREDAVNAFFKDS